MDVQEPIASGSLEPALECDAASALVDAFLAGNERIGERVRLRAHLARCAGCRERYEALVQTLAEVAARRRVEGRGGDAVGGHGSSGRARPRLAKTLLPGLGLFALWAIAGPRANEPKIEVASLGGTVRVGGDAIALGEAPRTLVRGRTCSTATQARGQITGATARLCVEPSSDVMVERASPLRVRLFAGTLLYEGTAVIACASGVLETNGRGLVHLDEQALSVASTAGEVRWVDPSGDRLLTQGQSVRLAFAGANGAD